MGIMNFNLANVVTFGAGAILIYAAVKNVSPREVITNATKGQSTKGNAKKTSAPEEPSSTRDPSTGHVVSV